MSEVLSSEEKDEILDNAYVVKINTEVLQDICNKQNRLLKDISDIVSSVNKNHISESLALSRIKNNLIANEYELNLR